MKEGPSQDKLDNLARQLGTLLLERGWHVTTAESCTGGWIAQTLTAVSGSSDWFETGFVTYSNVAKCALLQVDRLTIERYGAVSAETASEMAEGARKIGGADVAVAVTGIAGPSGGTPSKPIGTVWLGFAGTGVPTYTETHRFEGGRRAVRAHTVSVALCRLIELAS
jgi:nicotinamide-nucleotide amidase